MLNKHDRYQKESRRLIKRLNEIRKEIRNQPFIDVPPFQRGWETSIVLREDISNRSDADFILHLIDIGYHKTKHIHKLEHVKMIKRGIYEYDYKCGDGRTCTQSFVPDRISFSEKQFESLSIREKNYFYQSSYAYYSYNRISYNLNIPKYWITLKVKAVFYDKIMDKNGELETEYQEVLSKLQLPPYSKYFYSGRGRYRSESDKLKVNKLILKEQLNEYYESTKDN